MRVGIGPAREFQEDQFMVVAVKEVVGRRVPTPSVEDVLAKCQAEGVQFVNL